MTGSTRGKTTPGSTPGSYAPHSGRTSRVSLAVAPADGPSGGPYNAGSGFASAETLGVLRDIETGNGAYPATKMSDLARELVAYQPAVELSSGAAAWRYPKIEELRTEVRELIEAGADDDTLRRPLSKLARAHTDAGGDWRATRPLDVNTTLAHIDHGNILNMSGGRYTKHPMIGGDTGDVDTIAFPLGENRTTTVTLMGNDTYRVRRLRYVTRGRLAGSSVVEHEVDDIYDEQLGTAAYQASCWL